MFRFQSVVYGLLLVSLTLLNQPSFAVWPFSSGGSNQAAQNEARRDARNACNEASKEYKTALSELTNACNAVPAEGGGSGGIEKCLEAVACCFGGDTTNCSSSAGSTVHSAKINELQTLLDTLADQMTSVSSGTPQMSSLEDSQARARAAQGQLKMLNACPMRAAVDLDKAYEEAEKAREKLEQREDSINEIKEQITEAQQKLEEDKLKIEKEMKELELKTQKDFKEIRDQSDDAQKRLLEDIEAQEQRKTELLGAISGQEQAKADAYQAMTQKFTELEIQCWQEGVKKAQDTRAKILEKASQNKFSAGSLESLYKSVGSSTLEDTQKLVDYHKRLCEKTLLYKKSRELAQTQYNRIIESADKSIATIRQEVVKVELKISRMMTDDKAKIHKDTAEKIEMLSKAYEDGAAQLTKQYNTTVQAASQRIAQLQEQLAQKQAHLQAAQEHLQYKQAILDTRKASNPGDTSISQESWGKVNTAYYTLSSVATSYVDNCCGIENVEAAKGILEIISGLDIASTGASCTEERASQVKTSLGIN